NDAPVRRGELDDVERLDRARENEPAEGDGRDVVEMTSRDRLFALERRKNDVLVRRVDAARQRRGVRAGDARRGTAADAAGDGESLVDGHGARLPDHCLRGDGGGVFCWIGGDQFGVAAANYDRPAEAGLYTHRVAEAVHRQAEDVEARPDVADRARREDRALHRRRSCTVMATMSLSTPAAVTSAPAPGPVTTNGLVL